MTQRNTLFLVTTPMAIPSPIQLESTLQILDHNSSWNESYGAFSDSRHKLGGLSQPEEMCAAYCRPVENGDSSLLSLFINLFPFLFEPLLRRFISVLPIQG